MQAVLDWVMSHLGVISSVLSLIVVLDVALASSDLFKSNNAFQLVLASIKKVADFLSGVLPKPPQA